MILHGGRRGNPKRPTPRQEINPLGADRRAERKILVRELRKQRANGDGIYDGPRERVFAKRACLFEHADLDITEIPARFTVGLDQARELDRASESSRPAANE
jgi:hypothetical protein